MAYRLPDDDAAIRAQLDHREKAGYQLQTVEVVLKSRFEGRGTIRGELYTARSDNPSWLGPAPIEEMAAHIHRSHGPSGANREYLVELDHALERLGFPDPHVRALCAALPTTVAPTGLP